LRIIQAYLLRNFLVASGAVLFGLFLTWLTAEAVLHLERFREDAWEAWRISLMRTLDVVPLGLPIACLTGAVWSLTRSARFLELTAIRSGGVPLRRVLAPILIAAVLLGLGAAFFEDRVLVPVRTRLLELTEDSFAGSGGDVTYSNGRWWFARGSYLFAAEDYAEDPPRLDRVSVFELDDRRRIVRRIDALEARLLEDQTWEFTEARILDFDEQAGPELRLERDATIALDLSQQDLSRAVPAPDAISLHRLARWIREGPIHGAQRVSLQTAFHARLAQPFAMLILVLFALGLSVVDAERRDTLGRALLRSLLAAIVYWTAWTSALVLAGSGRVPPAVPLWGITVLFVGLGILRYRSIPE
jgi:lipopolysaccharide export system permease protein